MKEHPDFDKAFLATQRHRLIGMRDELLSMANFASHEQSDLQREAGGEAHDDADSAERLAIEENNEAQLSALTRRLAKIKRAIEKIDTGSYGISDRSGEPITRARLLAMPEAIYAAHEA
ncbi:TraR/DksA family transcriptional regulator [Dyella choica]|uniref:TraR/DksA family transcriptional regulator n=1 Tax=Dyella choica TaxID=1927959 RepID=A0A432MB60_9GAMM|nr:TraR/DksA family transcriptional regulator [Dyella choica]RUL78992.1 TraR/DksA family transcriptional regulator [Dyella choica]